MKTFVQQVRAAVHADSIGKNKDGNVVLRRTYFYGVTQDGSKFSESVSGQLTAAGVKHRVVDFGNHYAAFRGGASVKAGSHYWVEVAEAS